MDLTVKDVANLLHVSETTIQEWIANKNIPNYRIQNQHFFCLDEIQKWVVSHKHQLPKNSSFFNSTQEETEGTNPIKENKKKSGTRQFSFFRALHKGDILQNVPGKTKEDVIRTAMKTIAKNLNVDADVMTELLLERESLMATALNNGIGVPHTRDSLLNGHQDAVFIVFPETPLDYGALDEKPVHTLFFLFACEDKRHLHLLAKIAHFSSSQECLDFLQERPEKDRLLSYVQNWESHLQ